MSRLGGASVAVALLLCGCTLNTQGEGSETSEPDAATDAHADSPADRADADPCTQSSKLCSSKCVELSDPAYGCSIDSCQACVIPHATARCADFHCAIQACDPGWGDCNGKLDDGCEADLYTLENCGACGKECFVAHGAAACPAGTCNVASCNDGFSDCNATVTDGCEANLSSVDNCGACGHACTIDGGGDPACNDGVCGLSPCPSGFADCNGQIDDGCETAITTVDHCGACNVACALPHAAPACVSGVCKVAQCESPFWNCDQVDDNGCEVDVSTNVANCGGCGAPCSTDHGTNPTCSEGKCSLSCDDGFSDCDGPAPGNADDGCEGDLQAGPDSCGACGRSCSSAGTFARACVAGVCTSTCATGFGNCVLPAAPDPDDGCETDVSGDVSNCGACAAACNAVNASGAQCVAGACTFSCNPGFNDCNGPQPGLLDDGCEINVNADAQNCGGCGSACPLTNAGSASCDQGKCIYACSQGWGDCNGPHPASTADGCEFPTSTDPMNCGACSHACSKNNATDVVCTAGSCVPSCQPGWRDCAAPAAPAPDDGCESNPLTDPANCGGCGLKCGAGHVAQNLCSAGACAPVCEGGWANCDKSPPTPGGNNGCEQAISNDIQNCGACGRACSGDHVDSKSCSGGVCNSSCDWSWKNCSKPGGDKSDDGCETWGAVCW